MSDSAELLSRDELRELSRLRPHRFALSLAWTWGWIAVCFAAYLYRPGIVTALAGIVIISGRQLGLAILMHDAAHVLLARNKAWNDRLAQWLCAYPLMLDTVLYRMVHLQHHKHTWTERDPDLGLAKPFPISRRSFRRKLLRDLTGQTGVKYFYGLIRLYAGLSPRGKGRGGRTMGQLARTFWARQHGFVLINAALLGGCALAGHPEAYLLLWLVPMLTGYQLVLRLRSIAEHAAVSDPTRELEQTRTTLSPALVRFFIAPHNVNYHLEHHVYQFIPHYNLPRAHRLLAERGALDGAEVVRGYRHVWQRATSKSK